MDLNVLVRLLEEGHGSTAISKILGKPRSTVQALVTKHGLTGKLPPRTSHTKYTKELLTEVVLKSSSFGEILQELGLTESGSNATRIRQFIRAYEIDTSHFTPRARYVKERPAYLEAEFVFIINPQASISHIKRMAKKHVLPYVCQKCKNTGDWYEAPLTLQLDHISGDTSDNRLENLRWLCPNCHSQTETWGFKKRPTEDMV